MYVSMLKGSELIPFSQQLHMREFRKQAKRHFFLSFHATLTHKHTLYHTTISFHPKPRTTQKLYIAKAYTFPIYLFLQINRYTMHTKWKNKYHHNTVSFVVHTAHSKLTLHALHCYHLDPLRIILDVHKIYVLV